eukprot:Tbor_TRINITY_DN1825_c0_g1::TRINITY_DN1825_c0_g1_i2::g.23073::m.23073/K12483/EHD1; EH domain-containing protein 1
MTNVTGDGPAKNWDEHVKRTQDRLLELYRTYVKPLEDKYKYDVFNPTWFEETLHNSRPFVTFFGPWSAGKTTFINYLLQSNYLHTGPQPTTADFTVLIYGDEPGPIDGRILVNAKDLPFKGLTEFGESFLSNFQGFQVPQELLKNVILVDTPGVLESAKDIHQRKYDYIKLSRWFAERSDLMFVMFDPTKLDAGVELRMMFKHAFKGHEGKIRVVLNKADTVNTQELMRVYGSLFWNLSNMIDTTEPPRVYVGSFWDQPYREGTFTLLFSEEKTDLVHELTTIIPAQALDKKISGLIKRAKEVFVHSIITGGMRSSLPMFFGKEKAKAKAIDDLANTYQKVAAEFKMNHKDFPPVEQYRDFLKKCNLEEFPEIEKVKKEGLLQGIRELIDTILPKMIKPVKCTPIMDPRNKEERQMLQNRYNNTARDQFMGVQGQQASSDLVVNPLRPSAVAGVAQPQGGAQQDMMQMMMQMMAQQGQGGNSALTSITASAQQTSVCPSPSPAAAPAGFTPQQMEQMMLMMSSMQGGGVTPVPDNVD